MNGLRIGTPELARWGVTPDDAPMLAHYIAGALTGDDPDALAPAVAAERQRFSQLHFIHG